MKKLATLNRTGETSTVRASMLDSAATWRIEDIYDLFGTTAGGLDRAHVEQSRESYGRNVVEQGRNDDLLRRIVKAFINPFTCILIALAIVSACTDIIFAAPGDADPTTVVIISTMVAISGTLRFVQEGRSGRAAARLAAMISNTACVIRAEDGEQVIPIEDLVAGDLVRLSAGDLIPADMRLVQTKDLFLSEAALTGESEPVEKSAENRDVAFMGSTIVSGSATGIVVLVGNDTLLGATAATLSNEPPQTSFELGVSSVSWVLIRFMLVMVPVVLFINGFTKGDWMEAALFAVSVAVGLTPEMLPMIVTTCLAKGAVSMANENVIIKNLDAVQNLGSIDVLCCDKTGTLTLDRVALHRCLDVEGNDSRRVLHCSYLNSYHQTGLRNPMDSAVVASVEDGAEDALLRDLKTAYTKIDEAPFDFERRRMSVVVSDLSGATQMVTKGAVEEMLDVCSFANVGNEMVPLDERMRASALERVKELNAQGMRVLAVAQKADPRPVGAFSSEDETNMVLIGYLAFLDPPKGSAENAIRALREHNVDVKVLTGDNENVAAAVCRRVGVDTERIVLGSQVEDMDDERLSGVVEQASVFAKLSPDQKARVVTALRRNGHAVGFMGDGINDAAAMHVSDVGVSVDTAVDIAKESAQVVLLEKDLMCLREASSKAVARTRTRSSTSR